MRQKPKKSHRKVDLHGLLTLNSYVTECQLFRVDISTMGCALTHELLIINIVHQTHFQDKIMELFFQFWFHPPNLCSNVMNSYILEH